MADNLVEMIERARAAQAVVEFWDQARVDEMVAAAGWQVYQREHAEACARSAIDETKMGVYEHKLSKHMKKTLGTLRDLHGLKTVGIIESYPEKGLFKVAKPVGVIAALTPVTNASSTIGCNGLPILKTRNAVIFAPHPSAKKTCALTAEYLRAGLRQVGAPEDLVQCLREPSIAATGELMSMVDLIVATGGAGMVKAAYSSGTPAYGVGAGNSVTIVDETADQADAAHKIKLSKTFDNATSCSSENSAVIQVGIYDTMVRRLRDEGGYLCSPEEKARLQATMWPDGAHLSREIVGQSAQKIAKLAGIDVGDGVSFLMVEGAAVGPEDLFSGEKLSPVLTLWRFGDFEEAIDYVQRITEYSGKGHSCGIHSTNQDRIRELGMKARVTRIMVSQPQCYANSGDWVNGMPFSLTLGCGTWGGNAASENITWKHFINTTWVSAPIDPVIPTEESLFGDHWQKYGQA
jgi:sulfoacetaldehyde dehydrogenase